MLGGLWMNYGAVITAENAELKSEKQSLSRENQHLREQNRHLESRLNNFPHIEENEPEL